MTVSAHDVARELRVRLADLSVVKLHKLLYFIQGWHLAWTGDRLFTEEIEAFPNGPVVPMVRADEKYGRPIPTPSPLTPDGSSIVDFVIEKYGHLSARQLRIATHDEEPWRQTRIAAGDDLAWLDETGDDWQEPDGDTRSLPINPAEIEAAFTKRDEHQRYLEELERRRSRLSDAFTPGPRSTSFEAALEAALRQS